MRIAVSACLLGAHCRYDGKSKPCDDVIALKDHHDLIAICPEVMGGLSVPHPPNEIASVGPLRVVDVEGADNTAAFVAGARKSLDCAQREGCEFAILKAKSPSCGVGHVYDGSFTGALVEGDGVAASMFIKAGIPVCDEHSIPEDLLR